MPNPIYRVIIEYGYRKKGSARHYQFKLIDTFALTNDVKTIQNSEEIRRKLIRNKIWRNYTDPLLRDIIKLHTCGKYVSIKLTAIETSNSKFLIWINMESLYRTP